MAKCIQVTGQVAPVRTTDDEAFRIVDTEAGGRYVSKSTWRDSGTDAAEPVRAPALIRYSANRVKSGYIDSEAA